MSVSLARMKPEEGQEVADLVKLVVAPLPYYSVRARESEIGKYGSDSLVEMIQDDPHSVIFAREDNRAVGFCISKLDDGLIWLAWIGVHPNHRHHGVAGLLFDELERSARARKSHKIWADCRTDNEAMKALFPKMGFARICHVSNHWYNHDYLLWEKVVSA